MGVHESEALDASDRKPEANCLNQSGNLLASLTRSPEVMQISELADSALNLVL